MKASILERDLQYVWHPCSQMKFYEDNPPLIVEKAYGSYLQLKDGRKIIDAISSWWCKSLGHGHPKIKQALFDQAERFEHVILADVTHDTIVDLSERLGNISPSLKKVFYASDGSSAVEIAMKMSLHSKQLGGENQRSKFMALGNGYHGETSLAMSVTDLGHFKDPYRAVLTPSYFIVDIPYVSGRFDPLWQDCAELWPAIERQLEPYADSLTAILIEPIVQGAGGMRIYSQDFLRRLRVWTRTHNIHLIADEMMTGLGRTGLPLACQHAGIEPDFLCLGKGLTAGWLPMAAVVTSNQIYDYFYHQDISKAFLHSHTHTGNALAASVALATLKVMDEENIYAKAQAMEGILLKLMQEVERQTAAISNIRCIGGIVAADLIDLNAREVYKQAIQKGALLRPLGNSIYWLPPLNTECEVLEELKDITSSAINQAKNTKSSGLIEVIC
ncbi:MAG: adenosylmethionine--8-amino-7-oxononanoate transaminase [Gammaproteobacteria bacterium]|nr:adenosylmethionine--8-amino-7-oxononanoate transaminase [Gammaproteobacteria bacterium]